MFEGSGEWGVRGIGPKQNQNRAKTRPKQNQNRAKLRTGLLLAL